MAIRPVLRYPDERLRHSARPVDRTDEEIRRLAVDMLETMYAEGGVGLAATQVNVALRVVVMDLSEKRDEPLTLLNPEILEAEGSKDSQEGCLSVPDYFDTVKRAEKVRYRYRDLNGESIEGVADGLMAVCLQHEIDHLNGRLFIDYLSSLKRQRLRKKIQKQEKLQSTVL